MNPYESPREVPIERAPGVGLWEALVIVNPGTDWNLCAKDGLLAGLLAMVATPIVHMAINDQAPWLLAFLNIATAAWYGTLCAARIVKLLTDEK